MRRPTRAVTVWSIAWPADSASTPARASGAVISAVAPGAPAVGTRTGGRPVRAASSSRSASTVIRAATFGSAARIEASPSVNGHWLTTAAIPGSLAPISSTWPPANEEPQSAIASPRMPSSAAAEAQRGAPVLELAADVEQLARLAAASRRSSGR